jgi:hypothetical protein
MAKQWSDEVVSRLRTIPWYSRFSPDDPLLRIFAVTFHCRLENLVRYFSGNSFQFAAICRADAIVMFSAAFLISPQRYQLLPFRLSCKFPAASPSNRVKTAATEMT